MIADRNGIDPSSLRSLHRVALAAVIATYLLVVLGGIVRITGSGMGCGDDWPLCNGQIVPTMSLETFIEFAHRIVALVVSVLVVLVAFFAWRRSGTGDRAVRLRRAGVLAVILLVIQVLLGAITVWLELPPTSVVLHLGTAMLLLGVLVDITLETGSARTKRPDGFARACLLGAIGAFVVVLAGGLVANLEAAMACQGFPLCNGQWMPAGGNPKIHVHWGHRLLAYGLAAWVVWLAYLVRSRRPLDRATRLAVGSALALTAAQVLVAAGMVSMSLPAAFRVWHVALGTAVFVSLVVARWLAGHPLVGADLN